MILATGLGAIVYKIYNSNNQGKIRLNSIYSHTIVIHYELKTTDFWFNMYNKIIQIATNDPDKLHNEIIKNPLQYLKKYIEPYRNNWGQYDGIIIKHIEIISNNQIQNKVLLTKIADYLEINIDGIQDHLQIEHLIEDHIKYNPYKTLNDQYESLKGKYEEL